MTFQPGKSGNPKGRPPLIDSAKYAEIMTDKQSVKDCIRAYIKLTPLQMTSRLMQEDVTNCEHIVAELIQKSKGDHNATRLLFEMAFGEMTQGPATVSLNQVEIEMIEEYRRRTSFPELADGPRSGEDPE